MNDIIICDTREKNNKKILEFFSENSQDFIISKLEAGDYMLYKNYNTIIDKKDGLLELSHNLCNTLEHQRVKREIEKAKQLGCKNFIFLIQSDTIKSVEDIKNWKSKHTKVKGEILYKVMCTMHEKYQVRFIICSRKNTGKKIIELLGSKNETIKT